MQFNSYCRKKVYAGIIMKDESIKTANDILLVETDVDSSRPLNETTIATAHHVFVTLGENWVKMKGVSHKKIDFDITQTLLDSESIYGVTSNKIHLVVKSNDSEGQPIPANAFKPTFDYIDQDGLRIFKIHVDFFEDYSPLIKHCELDSSVMFLNSDGSHSDEVKRITENGNILDFASPFKFTSLRNEFILNDHRIVFDYDYTCHISLPRRQVPGEDECQPIARDPCQSAGCVKVRLVNSHWLRTVEAVL